MDKPLPPLTDEQTRCLALISGYIADHEYPPTIRELGTLLGRSKARIRQHLAELQRRRRIAVDPKVTRGIRVIR